jgi:hypothetical protein
MTNLLLTILSGSSRLLTSPRELVALASEVFPEPVAEDIVNRSTEFGQAVEELLDVAIEQATATAEPSTGERVELLLRTVHAFGSLFQLAREFGSTVSIDAESLRELLVDLPLLRAMRREASLATALLDFLGLVTIRANDQGTVVRGSKVNWASIADFFGDPISVARAGLVGADGVLDLRQFSLKTYALLHSVGIDVALRASTLDREGSLTALARGLGYELRASSLLLETIVLNDAETGLAVRATAIPFREATTDTLALGVVLSVAGAADLRVADGLEILVRTVGGPAAEVGLLFLPGPRIEATGEVVGSEDFGVELGFRRTSQAAPITLYQDDQFVIGMERIEAKTAVTRRAGRAEFLFETTIGGLGFQAGAKESDGFVKKVASDDGMGATFDITIGWSTVEGLYFQGGGGLQLAIPIHRTVGPIAIDTIYVAIEFERDIEATIAISFSAAIGPVSVAVDRIGLLLPIELGGGNGGPPLQLSSPKFKPPTGAGLAVTAGPVTGGGFLRHDKDRGSYDGILDLKFGEIGLTAVALITTKLPGGKKEGYALFVNIGVTFSPAITLPYNFNLQGCGGLLAVNRTMDVEALRSGLRNKTLDSILFPEDPILNANKIITDSERVFPIEEGRFVVGPMAKLGWGANGLIVADLAVVIELPSPVIIVILGQLKARCPKSDEAKVRLNLDVLGVLDIAKKSLSIDSTLYDSKILVYELYGDSALRLSWGSQRVFALSIGGFHCKFSPPANFPTLRRLTVQLRSSSSLELSCTMYHALTSNSVQFGARLRAHAEACGAALDGHLSFDTLIIFSPFEFEFNIDGKVSASYRGRDIASVRLSLDLSGPTPWHAKGKAKFSVLRWDVTAKFSKTWGSDDKAKLPKIDPLEPFMTEVALISNWGAALLPRTSIVESFKSLDAVVADDAEASTDTETDDECTVPDFLAHPAGGLEFRQRYVPLDLKLDMVANADVKNHFKLDVKMELDGGDQEQLPTLDNDRVEEHFARGQYKSLSKTDRLSKPSYELFKAGTHMVPLKARLQGRVEPCDLEYDTTVIREDRSRSREIRPNVSWALMQKTLRIAALKRASVRQRGLGKFKTGGDPRVRLKDETYVVVDKATLVPAPGMAPASGRAMTQTEAEDAVSAAVGADPGVAGTVVVVPEVEQEAA